MNGLLIAALTASSHANRLWQRSPAVLAMRCSARGYWSSCSATDAAAASLHLAARRGRECGNQQPIRVISSSVYAVHAVYAIDAVQQAAGAPVSP